ncbi:MAG: DUF4253 domain-containing protein [Lachnospiraceae bacterium]|nr:DUF4253 domain-containing protein [Lachnospiraceae bacterium]
MGMFDECKENNQVDGALALEQASTVTQSIVAQLGCPCQVFSANTAYETVMDAYWQAVKQGQSEGFTPVLVPSDDVLDEYLGILKNDDYKLEEVLKADLVSGEELLGNWYENYTEEFDLEEDGFDGEPDVIDSYSAFQDYRSGRTVETILVKVPTTRPWELVAYVPFGGWNDCPCVEEMMAVCKYWFEKYGAVPVTISHDVMEMRLPAPVPEKDVLQTAKEHFAFTTDRVYQCTRTGTLAEVAASIRTSAIWYFWWD